MDARVGRVRVAALALVAAVAVAACDDNKTRVVVAGSVLQPSVVPFAARFAPAIQPQVLIRQSVVGFGCPVVPPFSASFQIIVEQPPVQVIMNQVKIRFIDGSSIGGSPITFPSADLNRMFGNTIVRLGSSRSFPFTQRFGCFPVSPKVMSVSVTLADDTGASTESTMTANIQ